MYALLAVLACNNHLSMGDAITIVGMMIAAAAVMVAYIIWGD